MHNGVTELARLFKERENPTMPSIIAGTVVQNFPDIKIKIDERIVLDKTNLIFSASILENYNRKIALSGNIQFNNSDCGSTNSVNDGGYQASSHEHTIEELNINTSYNAAGNIEFTNTVTINDEVILMPAANGQLYYVLDKAVRL